MRVYKTFTIEDFASEKELGDYLDGGVDVRRGFAKIEKAEVLSDAAGEYLSLSLIYIVNGKDKEETFSIVGRDEEEHPYYIEFLEKLGRKNKSLLKGPRTLVGEEVMYFLNCKWRGLAIREEFECLLRGGK